MYRLLCITSTAGQHPALITGHMYIMTFVWCQLKQCADDSISDLEVVLEEDLNGVACKFVYKKTLKSNVKKIHL